MGSSRRNLLMALGAFFLAYPFFLVLWLQVKPFYGAALTGAGVRLAAFTRDAHLKSLEFGEEEAKVVLSKSIATPRGMADVDLDLQVPVSSYSFNVPLTLSLMVSMWFLVRWRPLHGILSLLILVAVHLLYVYSYASLFSMSGMEKAGLVDFSGHERLFWEFLWGFTDNLLIRFEPFLVSVYLWLAGGCGWLSNGGVRPE